MSENTKIYSLILSELGNFRGFRLRAPSRASLWTHRGPRDNLQTPTCLMHSLFPVQIFLDPPMNINVSFNAIFLLRGTLLNTFN